jgi:hypothetical protein
MVVSAELFDRGNGLIYDDELDVTWVQIADLAAGTSFDDGGGTFGNPLTDGLLTWDSATAFVDSLDYAGFDDWRLPTMDRDGNSVVVNCAVATQAQCLDNELGYLYYYGLGGTGAPLTGDTGPFTGILFRYWGSDEVAPTSAWTFDFVGGIQGPVDKNGDAFANPAGAWAVRSGDVTQGANLIIDNNGQLLGATDVDVNGTLYTVTFTKGNCIDEFDGCDSVTDFDFDNQADAEAAALALSNTVFVGAFDRNPPLQNGCDEFSASGCGIFTPFGFSGQPPNQFLVVAPFYNRPNEADDEVPGAQSRVLDIELNFAQTWARWERQDPTPTIEVSISADECTVTAGGCNPTGLHEFTLPDGFVPPPGATISQTVYPYSDTRADANGRCDGQTPQVLFDGDLIIPEYLCGSPEFQVIVTETNFDILEGTIFNTVFPDQFVSNPIDCNTPIVGDPQLQSAFVWQPTDSADVLEGSAIALTNGCGSSRARIRGFSFVVVGLHIDFGLDFDADPEAVTQAFIDRASTDLNTLVAAVVNARPALNRKDYRKLRKVARLAERLHNRGRYRAASRLVQLFLFLTDRARFDTSVGFNHEGNLLSRADHIRFLLDEFIVPF